MKKIKNGRPEIITTSQNLGKGLLAGRGEGAQSALEGGVCCAPVVGPVVVPEAGAAGGEEGAALAPTLEHLRAPVVRSHVGPEHRRSIFLFSYHLLLIDTCNLYYLNALLNTKQDPESIRTLDPDPGRQK
jgi:hypothetical protein